MAGTALALAISGGVGIAIYNNNPERRYQKNIAMAEKYLEEYNFEKAEEYLNIAKNIDPKKEEAYKDLVTVYKAKGETAKADTVISEAQQTLSTSEQSSFLAKLESLTDRATQLAQASLEVQKIEATKTSSSSASSITKTSSAAQPSTETQKTENSATDPKNEEAVAIAERPIVDAKDLTHVDDIDGQSVTIPLNDTNLDTASISSEEETKQKNSGDVISTSSKKEKEMTNTSEDSIKSSIESETQVVSPLPNTPYTVVSEIGALDITPIALNSDCWVIKKGNEFQFLFPDGSTKKLNSKDQLVLQANTNHTGNTTLVSSACLIESSSQNNIQYYPKEEEASSCLLSSSEKTSYPLEGEYKNTTTPVLVRSSNQSGYWIYNPAYKALYGPFKDSEDTSFYSKVSRLSDITLVGHNGQISGPYWTC
ncbi:MAG: hypothetical protein K2H85_05890, partial [Allobaculum sp.]|nr:hypothetical protein [Allobaculum sp.]